jgi:hypothetical protein
VPNSTKRKAKICYFGQRHKTYYTEKGGLNDEVLKPGKTVDIIYEPVIIETSPILLGICTDFWE